MAAPVLALIHQLLQLLQLTKNALWAMLPFSRTALAAQVWSTLLTRCGPQYIMGLATATEA
jgi:hypothetical protein